MIRPWQVRSHGLGRAIFQQDTRIVSEHGIPDRRFHAHARGASDEDEVFRIELSKDGIQVGLIKAAVAMLVKDDIASLGRKLGYNVRVPRVPDEDSALGAVG